jgi:hypothetical protein
MLPVNPDLNRAIVAMAESAFPAGFDVAAHAPSTFRDLRAHVSLTGRMLVWAGASDRTIYADPRVNWSMRAWHDSCHLAGSHDFTLQGEARACFDQLGAMRARFPRMPESWRRIVWLEVIGQALHADATGEFVSDQYGFVASRLALPFGTL